MPAARIGPAPSNENALRLSELRLSPLRLDELRLDERLWVRVAIDFSLVWIACANGQGRGGVPVVKRPSRTVRRIATACSRRTAGVLQEESIRTRSLVLWAR